MNIAQAKGALDLKDILEHLGHEPIQSKSKPFDLWYCSPFYDEHSPSFHIHIHKNIWYDFKLQRGGDIISFAREYLASRNQPNMVKDALNWLRPFYNVPAKPTPSPQP